ncbi:hypothetical protein L2E82_35473 [Cichorium intybus]|uniref:Uncharacterized protein n=1 Tax=Cichorium intybus TaxID=13427 RepID=A0ACB9BNX3_CICIN|nr:hypothetical protein L2E82_35473 [Cichorium intybus]
MGSEEERNRRLEDLLLEDNATESKRAAYWKSSREMVTSRHGSTNGSQNEKENHDFRRLVAFEVGEALQELHLGFFMQWRVELAHDLDKKVSVSMKGNEGLSQPQPKSYTYRNYSA